MDQHTESTGPPEQIGPLLTALRSEKGYSQLRVAEKLCELSGIGTVTRNEVSRWERQERIPSLFSMRWLATVLEAPVERLEAAAAVARTAAAARPADGGHAPTKAAPRRSAPPPGGQPTKDPTDTRQADDPVSTVSIRFEHQQTRVRFSGTYTDPRQAVSAIGAFRSMVGDTDAGRQSDPERPRVASPATAARPSTLAGTPISIRYTGGPGARTPGEERNGHA